jgi:signal transduction histidine kinase
VAGWVFQHQKPVIINDAYKDPRFCSDVDQKTGFQTRNILCIPLINRYKNHIGTLQALNKICGDFTMEDIELLFSASHYIAVALENARLYEQMDLMLKAKERVINHLSHELKTPLAVISGALEGIRRRIGAECASGLDRTINRGLRNVARLLDLQRKIDDILNQREAGDRQSIRRIVEAAADLIEGLADEHQGSKKQTLELIFARLDQVYQLREHRPETISLNPFMDWICERTGQGIGNREIRIERNYGRPVCLVVDPNILSLSCEGLLRNAIENTPDEGEVRVSTYSEDGIVSIRIHDYGVGITPENQKLIFVGFFHTQQTDGYSSKVPYAFNAGGAGVDLFRIKTFAERSGFDVDFESRRCCYLSTDGDACPGRISACRFISSPTDCLRSGFSTFELRFNSRPF